LQLILITIYGEKDQEGRHHREVRNPLRFGHQKDRQEVRAPAASQIRLSRLRKGTSLLTQSQIKRLAAGIWKCRGCKTTFAGGAFEFATSVATTAKVTMNRLKKLKEELANVPKEEEQVQDKKKEKKEKK
jgi:large subunit ribosomal protein L37Ae